MSREQRETIDVITHGTRNVELRDSDLRARGSQLRERGLESASTASLSELQYQRLCFPGRPDTHTERCA